MLLARMFCKPSGKKRFLSHHEYNWKGKILPQKKYKDTQLFNAEAQFKGWGEKLE